MNARTFKWIVVWNVVVTLLMLVSVAANATLAEAANDPPVQVFNNTFDINGGASDQNLTDVLIQNATYTNVAEVTVTLPEDKPHMCLATGSAEVEHQSGSGLYGVALRRNGIVLPASIRHFELIDNAGNEDPKYKEISTVAAWTNLTGASTLQFASRKNGPGDPDMQVTNASLIVICVKKILGS